MPKLSRTIWLALVGAAMSVFLVGSILARAAAVAGAPEIVMAIEGSDPRAVLLGHYVAVQLAPADGPVEAVTGDDLVAGKPVWIVLAPAPGRARWRVATLSARKPAALTQGQRAVRGVFYGQAAPGEPAIAPRISYWVDRIYLDQARAQRVEAAIRAAQTSQGAPDVALTLGVAGDGRLLPKAVLIGEERIALATLT